jgi:hypothetical protein
VNKSIGKGTIVVEFFSAETFVKVWRNRRWMAVVAMIMRKMIKKKIAGEIPAIGLSPFQILYQYEDSS